MSSHKQCTCGITERIRPAMRAMALVAYGILILSRPAAQETAGNIHETYDFTLTVVEHALGV